MSRTYAREAVFGTLKNYGVEPTTVTLKTKFAAVLKPEMRVEFARELNDKFPAARDLHPTHLGFFTVGQMVKMASQLPGQDNTPGRRKPPQPTPPNEQSGGRRR